MIVMMSSFLWRVSPLSSVSHRAAWSSCWRVKYTRTHLLFLLWDGDLNTHLNIRIWWVLGVFQMVFYCHKVDRELYVWTHSERYCRWAFYMVSLCKWNLFLMYVLQLHVCFWLHSLLRWHLLTSVAQSPSTLVSSTTVIKSSHIGWTCCHGTCSRIKKLLIKKGINRPLAFWASQIGQ